MHGINHQNMGLGKLQYFITLKAILGIIPLYIHHDSRVRSRREVTIFFTQLAGR